MLSLPHLVVLFVVALIIFGPQKLPELARMLGKATAEFRKMSNDFRFALEQEVGEIDRQTRIRDAEVAAALKPVLPSTSQPEATVPRDVSVPEPAPQPEPAQADASPVPGADAQPSHTPSHTAPDAVTKPHEKPPDDNTAI